MWSWLCTPASQPPLHWQAKLVELAAATLDAAVWTVEQVAATWAR